MDQPAHNTAPQSHTNHACFYPSAFTGKERDEETGFGYLPQQVRQAYHGARYMDHELMTMWLNVDPMADKYPSISPYAYCAWNPVKIVDPDGRAANPVYNKDGVFMGNTKEGFIGEPFLCCKMKRYNHLTREQRYTISVCLRKKCRCRELQIQAPTATSELAHTDKEMCKFAPVNRWRKEIAWCLGIVGVGLVWRYIIESIYKPYTNHIESIYKAYTGMFYKFVLKKTPTGYNC